MNEAHRRFRGVFYKVVLGLLAFAVIWSAGVWLSITVFNPGDALAGAGYEPKPEVAEKSKPGSSLVAALDLGLMLKQRGDYRDCLIRVAAGIVARHLRTAGNPEKVLVESVGVCDAIWTEMRGGWESE